jgi:hypothetical protein
MAIAAEKAALGFEDFVFRTFHAADTRTPNESDAKSGDHRGGIPLSEGESRGLALWRGSGRREASGALVGWAEWEPADDLRKLGAAGYVAPDGILIEKSKAAEAFADDHDSLT